MTPPPGPGMLLLASPLLLDPNFYQAAVLMISHDDEGSFGLVLNRPSPSPLGDGLGGACPETLRDRTLYDGGPVETQAFFCLHNNVLGLDSVEEIVPGVFLGGEAAILDSYAFDNPPADFKTRFYAGYSGWGTGQLDQEITEGSWIVTPATAEDIFGDSATLWSRHLEPGPRPDGGAALN